MSTLDAEPTLPGLGTPAPVSEPPVRERSRTDPHLPVTTAAKHAFWSHIVRAPSDGCWIWTASISTTDAYGRVTWRRGGRSRTVSAHRLALMIHLGGELPAGLVAEHACDEPLCVRVAPGHVHLSTQADNNRYAVARGRHCGNRPSPAVARDRVARSRAVRAAVAGGWDEAAYRAAAHLPTGEPQLPLPPTHQTG